MQTDVSDALPTIEHFVYDVMGRLRVDSTVSSTFSYTATFDSSRTVPSLTRSVHDSLDAEGALLISTRASVPALTDFTTQQTTFTYDAAHRQRTRTEQNSSTDSTWYDPAGNPVLHRSARQKAVTQTYDALNHLVTRVLPPDTTAQDNCSGACTNGAAFVYGRFPYWPTVLPGGSTTNDLIIQGDTATYTYDAAGHMLSAYQSATMRRFGAATSPAVRWHPRSIVCATTIRQTP